MVMEMNFWLVFVTGLIPLITGSIYYNVKVMGNTWMKEASITLEDTMKSNMIKIFGLTYVGGVLISMVLMVLVVHQMSISSAFQGTDFMTEGTTNAQIYNGAMEAVQGNFRTFKHGALHGTITAIFLAMPLLAIPALFERKSFKYIGIHTLYYVITLALMGGVLCAYL